MFLWSYLICYAHGNLVINLMDSSRASFIKAILQEASVVGTANFGKVAGTTKPEDKNQVLTETELEIGKLLVDRIRAEYTEHNVIDEEAGVIDNGSEWTWVVDPIDGTSNFANGVPTYGCMVGLLEGGVPVAGGVALPGFGQIAVAEKGGGAYLNGERMQVSEENDLLHCLVAYGIDGHQEDPEQRPDMPKEWKEKISWDFLKFMWTYRKKERSKVITLMKEYRDGKQTLIFKRPVEAEQFLVSIKNNHE